MGEVLGELCGEEFVVFSSPKLFSACFESFAFVLGPFALLALVSGFYVGRLRPPDVRLTVPATFNVRRVCTLVALVVVAAQFFTDVVVYRDCPPVVGLSHGVRFVSLLAHLLFLWRLCLVHFQFQRGPTPVVLAWLLTLPSYGSAVWGAAMQGGSLRLLIELLLASTSAASQAVYLVATLRGNPKFRTVSILGGDSDVAAPSDSGAYYAVGEADFPSQPRGSPSDTAPWPSLLFFWWVNPLMKRGSRGGLKVEDGVYNLPDDLSSEALCSAFEEEFPEQTEPSRSNRVVTLLFRRFGRRYLSLGVLKFGADGLAFVGPVVLNLLVTYVGSEEPLSTGWCYVGALFGSTFVGSLLATHFDYQVNKVAIGMKSCLIGAVFAKTMASKYVHMAKYATGEVTNYMSTDCNRIVNFCPSFHQLWSLPFQVAITLALLYLQVGVVFLAGLGVAVAMVFFNHYLARKIGEYNVAMMEHKDSRIKLMTELLMGIRVVKFNAWEGFLTEKINNIRADELSSLQGIKYFDAGCVYLWATTPVVISVVTFSVYSTMGNPLTAAKVFTVVALVNMLISPLNAFPWVVNGMMEAWTSLQRIESFLRTPDCDEDYFDALAPPTELAMEVCGGAFSWDVPGDNEQGLMLRDLSLSVSKGQLVGIFGPVGSGKSSLLSALLGSTRKVGGRVTVQGGVAYVAQEPWLQHASIRENILWGSAYDEDLYDVILECCALSHDLMSLPSGDLTEVGENGVTLSGGQRSRVALARAIYQDKSIYLLDDPLSAVDCHVGSHIYRHCIAGILREKTRILVTHHVKYLRNADLVVEMERGRIKRMGTPQDVFGCGFGDETGVDADGALTQPCTNQSENKLIDKEDKASGTVNISVYKSYWLAVGACLSFLVLLFLVLMQASKAISDWWLAEWVNNNSTNHISLTFPTDQSHNLSTVLGQPIFITDTSYTFLLAGTSEHTGSAHDASWYLMIYGTIAGINSVFTLFRAFLFAYGGLKAAKVLHSKLLASILQAPTSFFDCTPVGRIINRFTSDMYTVDDSLPFMLNIFLAQLVGLLATLVVTCVGLPWFAIILLPLGVFYYCTQQYYRLSSRELKRLSSVSLSPIYVHFSESLRGMETIRAFRKQEMFNSKNCELVDANQRCNFSTLAAQEWLAIRLQMMGVVMVTSVALTTVLEHHFSQASAGLVGLALSYALSVTGRLSGVVTSFTETEKQMVAVERQSHYINHVAQELSVPFNEVRVRGSWPQEGAIEFKQVSLRYRENLPPALNDVTFRIEGGEKVGVVGRTGSGKSSLLAALLGTTPLCGGNIFVDGTNIKRVQLHTLRSRIAIIPQDPFLFSGTVAENLDPTMGQSDASLQWALSSCGLNVDLLGGLQGQVGERGQRLSVGQRQLVCLARALLKNATVVCLDEATANVDSKSDLLIQETMRRHFSRCTVITIAHRTETVLQSDRVVVMDGGRVSEIDAPDKLLRDTESLFYKLVNSSST